MTKLLSRLVLCAVGPALIVLSTLVGLDYGFKLIQADSATRLVEQADRILPDDIAVRMKDLGE